MSPQKPTGIEGMGRVITNSPSASVISLPSSSYAVAATPRQGPESSTPGPNCSRTRLRTVNPNAFPALTRNLGLLENNAFLVRWDSGRDRPMDRSFETALELLVLGLRAKLNTQ
ncbi:hypothetical protein [Streptomyces sp. NBC_00989]|uniref:hypothetical protein n=1 Tax=Streptomyces sp. NBC_00989 TaxID=2903705 RepID=UPI00386AD200|nr:hypothetical protein OG714_05310 [Streptomyces sp. NBC_00989]